MISPLEDPELKQVVMRDLEDLLKDNCQAWDLGADGAYTRRSPAEGEPEFNSQMELLKRYSRC